ncbi:MAG: hypothetical protein LBU83_07560 [Bacteroidales bacterium]|jgi:hypothetical protein|nr:hypothetical protein [Bacteroidales bacterium]
MRKLALIVFCSLFMFNFSFGQDKEKYAELIKKAWQLYESKEYLQSGQKYAEAFIALGGKGMTNDRYNAACSWALANEIDSAFVQLFKIAKNGNYTNLGHITTDSDLNVLHKDERWEQVIEIVKSNKEKAELNLDKPLVAILDTIYQDDQKYRQELRSIEDKYGWESEEMKTQWKIISQKDSINLIKVKNILDERGWLGADIIGGQGNMTLFLVIQHSDLGTQDKYLPMMREAVNKGNASASSLALLEDRVALGKGEKQIYGSQIGRDNETEEYYVLPLMDPDNVDKRRAEVGLEPIQNYISRWDITWDVEEYKKKLSEYELKQKDE